VAAPLIQTVLDAVDVPSTTSNAAAAAMSDPSCGDPHRDADLLAALVFARKKRLGPFASSRDLSGTFAASESLPETSEGDTIDPRDNSPSTMSSRRGGSSRDAWIKALAKFAQAGYSFAIAKQVLDMRPTEASAWIALPK
jgi:hypothetical protein